MGVNQLWNILEPVRKKENLTALRNKTLCVDLSGWICEARCAKGLKHNVSKPHLRNLFFRLLHLTRLGVKLVFVVDGEPPELKWAAIVKRIQARNDGQKWRSNNSQKTVPRARVGRSHFAVWVRECRNLLNLLGTPCIESGGEAEALCAWLDLHQIVDGCITNDGDAFLYGARTVYKDLCITGKDASVECYEMKEIESQLNLNRQKLVALALLLGCDYLPHGVSGVGKEIAMKLMRNVNHDNLIERFYEWSRGSCRDEDLSSVEKSVKCKALKDKNFPHPEVIQEFLAPKVVPQRISLKIMSPDLQGLQEFCLKNLEWPEEYTRDKPAFDTPLKTTDHYFQYSEGSVIVLLLLTYWQMTSSLQQHSTVLVQPERIVKARIQQKLECYEVRWKNVELGGACPSSFVTIESREIFNQVYPDLVEEFHNGEEAKLSKKPKRKQQEKVSTSNGCESEIDALSQQLKDLSVCHPSGHLSVSAISNKRRSVAGDNNCEEECLQDIIDSVLPDSPESFSPFARMNEDYCNLSADGATRVGNDCHSDKDGDDDHDDHDSGYPGHHDFNSGNIPCILQPLKMKVTGGTTTQLSKSSGASLCCDSKKCEVLKTKAAEGNSDVLELFDGNDQRECDRFSTYEEESVTSLGVKEAGMKPISCPETLIVVDSSDDDDENNYRYCREKPLFKQSTKIQKEETLHRDADPSEIFGSSDLWSSDNENEEATDSCDHGKAYLLTNLSIQTVDDLVANSLRKSAQDTKPHLHCDASTSYAITPEFEENAGRGCTVLQDTSSAKLNAASFKDDVHSETGSNVLEGMTKHSSHKSPCISFVPHIYNSSLKTTRCDTINEVNAVRHSEMLHKEESWKENIDSPFDDHMPAPLFQRLGKKFSAKQRLASLRSISTAADEN